MTVDGIAPVFSFALGIPPAKVAPAISGARSGGTPVVRGRPAQPPSDHAGLMSASRPNIRLRVAVAIGLGHIAHGRRIAGWRKELFVRFSIWLLVGLQFALAADVVRSVIAPTWNEIGQLAAIAAIRTFLNYFLERDIEAFDKT
jgi:uncharacterized membrane protein